MPLPANDIDRLYKRYMKQISRSHETIALRKNQLRNLFDFADAFLDAQLPTFKAGLPGPIRNNTTDRQAVDVFRFLLTAYLGDN